MPVMSRYCGGILSSDVFDFNNNKENNMNKLLIAAALAASLATTSAMASFIPAFEAGGNAETGDNLWEFTDINDIQDDAGFHLTAQFGGSNSSGTREFGLYQYDAVNESMINTLAIFYDADMASGSAATNVSLDFSGETLTAQGGTIDTSLALGLIFGFYFESDGNTYYSQEAFNGGGLDFFGFYDEASTLSPFNNHIYAEDNGSGSSLDWITMSVSDIDTFKIVGTTTTVPEPGSIALFGAGLLGIVARRKIKAKKVS
jgi:hypothetical protein